jgi:hypothetical protein
MRASNRFDQIGHASGQRCTRRPTGSDDVGIEENLARPAGGHLRRLGKRISYDLFLS